MWSQYSANLDDIFCFMKRFPRVCMETAGDRILLVMAGWTPVSEQRMVY